MPLIARIIDISIVFIALMALPLNAIIYFALLDSEYYIPRLVPPLLGAVAIAAALLKKRMTAEWKIWGLITVLFTTGCYNLLLGLIDMASLWFVLAIIYTTFISQKHEALILFGASFTAVFVTGVLMITKATFIPLQYGFDNCMFACIAVRILHFLMIGSLVYYILSTFYSEIRKNFSELRKQSNDLELVNRALERESIEKKEAQRKILEAVVLTEEVERKRLAADLHDGLGPVLSAVNLFFQAYIDAGDHARRAPIELKLKAAIDTAIADVSRIARNISPHILEQFGLAKALETYIHSITAAGGMQFEMQFGNIGRFDLKRELALYRTITELIHNTVKHAAATRITICYSAAGGLLTADYSDNGRGFSDRKTEEIGHGMGLINLRNRIRSLGGSITLQSSLPNGMTARIEMPLGGGSAQ